MKLSLVQVRPESQYNTGTLTPSTSAAGGMNLLVSGWSSIEICDRFCVVLLPMEGVTDVRRELHRRVRRCGVMLEFSDHATEYLGLGDQLWIQFECPG